MLHRRWVSAALVFCSVLFALQVLAPGDASSTSPHSTDQTVPVDDGLVQFPLRLSDAAVAALLAPGDRVDVYGSQLRGSTTLVAQDLVVVDVPQPVDGVFGGSGDGLVVVAVSADGALALADATSRGPVTVAVRP